MGPLTRLLQNLRLGGDGLGGKLVPVAVIGLAGVLALLFIHIFVALLLTVAAYLLGKGLLERAMGPGTKIRLNLPVSAIIARLRGRTPRK